ncbi:RDD family protein [Actinomadura flavalba]|uniref:RDD family protein n=1 Tax=Actinomadura flavalba TaxID=1120938 RepID=UPI000376A020|nr:RDD family protein [Actinomadura flavalba]
MAELVSGEAVALDLRVARLASRGCALLVDLLIQMTLFGIVTNVIGPIAAVADPAWVAGLTLLSLVAVVVGYPCVMETATRGHTLGKMLLGLRVVSDDGGPVRFRQTLLRALAGFLEFWTFLAIPALIASLCSSRGKRLGDVFAGTIVIQERASGPAHFGPIAVMPPGLAGWASRLELSGVSDGLAMTARQYIARFWELLPEVRDELGDRIVAEVAAVISPPPPPGWRPELVLSAVLAERRTREERRLAAQRAYLRRLRGLPPEPPAAPPWAPAGGPPPPPPRPPAPPPFSDPGPGQPRFLPPQHYPAGPYRDVLGGR